MRILVSNDDGVHSPGLHALVRAMASLGEVVVVAPDRERSAVGHSLTFFHPVRLEPIRPAHCVEEATYYACDGTPTDCVLLALYSIMIDSPPAIVVSGINRGANLGDDIHYSGTASAAMEAAIHGRPAVAVSLAAHRDPLWDTAAHAASRVVSAVLERGLPERTFLNVNVPNIAQESLRGFATTVQGRTIYRQQVVARTDPRGNHYYWITGEPPTGDPEPHTDFAALASHRVSVTPVGLDLTRHAFMPSLDDWTW
jgi:5'-nucleotidase